MGADRARRGALALLLAISPVVAGCARAADDAAPSGSDAAGPDGADRTTAPPAGRDAGAPPDDAGTPPGGDGGDGDPSGVPPAASGSTGAPPSSEACAPVVVVDEYGNDVELSSCDLAPADDDRDGGVDDERTVTTLVLDEAVAAVPSATARDGLDAALVASADLARRCGDPAAWAAGAEVVADGVARVAAEVAADPELEAWRGGDGALAIAAVLRDRLLLADGCEAAAPAEADAPAGADAAVLAAAGRIAGANDDVHAALSGVTPLVFASDLWYNANALAHLIDLLALDEPVDVLMLGPSTALRGFDPLALTDATGRLAYNAGLGALPLDLQGWWWEMLTTSGLDAVRPSTVVLGLNTWIPFRACEDDQVAAVAASAELRAGAFEAVGLGDVPPGLRIVGGAEPSYRGVVLDADRQILPAGDRGRAVIGDAFDRATFDTQVEINVARQSFGPDEACPGRRAAERALIDAIVADGVEVVLVVLPTSDAMADLHPDGRAGHDAVVDEYRAIADDVGGRLLDLSDAAPDERFVDLTHLDPEGRALITGAIADLLGRR